MDRLILFGEDTLRTTAREFVAHYHGERNHKGIGNLLIFPDPGLTGRDGAVRRRSCTRLNAQLLRPRRLTTSVAVFG